MVLGGGGMGVVVGDRPVDRSTGIIDICSSRSCL